MRTGVNSWGNVYLLFSKTLFYMLPINIHYVPTGFTGGFVGTPADMVNVR